MTELVGWTKKLLRINLSDNSIFVETIPDEVLRTYIGGKGLASYYINTELYPKVDPLDPENIVIFATGPAQGLLPIAGRYVVVSKSPLSGIFIDSHVGGFFGPEMKFAGYDVIIIKGKAVKPCYITITNDNITINDASHLWGKTTLDTEDYLKEEFDSKSKIVSIGPAGENLVRYAALCSDYYRTAGRGGIGMIFGSKNLKAIAIRGTNKLKTNDRLKEIARDINSRAKLSQESGHLLPKLGTSWLLEISNARTQLPTLNYSSGEYEKVEKIEGRAIDKKFEGKLIRKPCYRCSLACAYVIDTDYNWAEARKIQHPEYESLALLGSNLGISDLETILHANHICNEYGIDTISTGSSISWFIEIGKHNLIPDEYLDEKIGFGDADGVIEMIIKIATKNGVGKILAEGVKVASKIFGNMTENYAVHVRGLELPAWDPRGKLGLGLSYITSNVGGSHLRGWPKTQSYPNTSAIPVIDSLIEEQDLKLLKDSLIMCHFTHSIKPALSLDDIAKLYHAFTGIVVNSSDMRDKAQKIWILARDFNVRVMNGSGLNRGDEVLPKRLRFDPLPSGIGKGLTAFVNEEDMQESLNIFYEKRNCYSNGVPTDEELKKTFFFD